MAQLIPLLLTVSCSSKIQIGFTFLVPAHLGSPGQRAVKRVCVCVCVYVFIFTPICWNLPLFCSGDVWTVSEEFLHPIKRLNTREAAQGLCQADQLNSLPVLTL